MRYRNGQWFYRTGTGRPVQSLLAFAIGMVTVVLLLVVVTWYYPAAPTPVAEPALVLDVDPVRPGTQLGVITSLVALIWMYPGLMTFCFFPTVCLIVLLFGKLIIDDLANED